MRGADRRRAQLAGRREALPARRTARCVWVARSVTLVRDADGQPLHLLDQIQDITERAPLRARAATARRPRPADRPAQPPPLRAGARPPRRRASRATGRAARCSCSTSTTSSTSTTRSATTPATSCILSVAGAAAGPRCARRDVLARLGGDEFAVLLPDADRAEAEQVAAALVQARARAGRRARPASAGGAVTTSVGVAPVRRADAQRRGAARSRPTWRCTRPRRRGRDRWSSSRRDGRRPARIRARVDAGSSASARALDDDGFVLYAQPILRPAQRATIRQHELLLRMRGDDGDARSPPAAFLPLAERFGLMPEIDRWVVGAGDRAAGRRAAAASRRARGQPVRRSRSTTPTLPATHRDRARAHRRSTRAA